MIPVALQPPERIPYTVITYETEPITGMMSVSELWENLDTRKDPFKVEIVKEWMEGDILFRRFYYTSRTVSDGAVRIYAIYGADKNGRQPALLHIHGGGQTANEDWVRYLTGNGYAVLSIDWGGIWDHKVNGYARYPESLYYANHQFSGERLYTGNPDMRGNPWYEWCYACMRGITYLEQQTEVNSDLIGIYGISMGGSMVWNVAAIDKRVKASIAIYGAGWNTYQSQFNKYGDKHFLPDDQQKIWLSAMTPEIYAQYIDTPMMMLSTSNDFHGNIDRLCDTFDSLPDTTIRRLSFGVSHNHHIEYNQVPNLLIWFDSHLKSETKLPENPDISVIKGDDDIPEVIMAVDENADVLWVKMFYALENVNPYNRYWQEAYAKNCGEGIFSIKAPVMDTTKYLFAYASVKYKDGLHLSTKQIAIKPDSLSCKATAQKTLSIYEADEGKSGWAGKYWCTDPIPLAPYYVFEDQLMAPANGGVSTRQNKKIITNRLTDPRFSDDENNAALLFEFHATIPGEISISFGDEPFSGAPYSSFDRCYRYTLLVGRTEIVIRRSGSDIDGWLNYPQIVISGLDGESIILFSIKWE